jgi:membrane associated rhomboid family serine protease
MSSRRPLLVLSALSLLWVLLFVARLRWAADAPPVPLATMLEKWGALQVPLPSAELWRLGTTWFVHVDYWHLLGSLLALWAGGLGSLQRLRAGRLLGLLVSCGLVASLAVVWRSAGQPLISAGPSGALCGLLAFVVLLPAAGKRVLLPLVALVAMVVGGYVTAGDTVAHLAGAGAGLLLAGVQRLRA